MGIDGLLVDGVIILVYFVVITAIGLYMGRREESLNDFALGGRRVPWWAVMASIIAAETSAATFLGAPGEGYTKKSLAYVQLVLGLIIGRVIVGHVFLKPYFAYKVYTVYDYLGIRFGPWTKGYVSALFLFMRTLASGTRLFIPSLVMVLAYRMFVAGGQVQFSQQAVTTVGPYLVAIVLLTIVTCLYTAVGGIKAVIWTDVIQACLMFGGALIAIGTLLYHVGGLSEVVRAVPQLTTHEGYFLHGFEASVAAYRPAATADVFGSYILNVMPVGIRGLVLAGIFATAMGSFSAALNALATGATNDWYLRWVRGRSEAHYVQAARWFTVLFAALMIVIAGAFAYAKVTHPDLRIIPVVLGIAGFILGPMLGVFLIGMFTERRGSDTGNMIAISAGLVATVVVGKLDIALVNTVAPLFGIDGTFQHPARIPEVSFTWWAMIGALVVFSVGVLFRTPDPVLESAARHADEAQTAEDVPLALREQPLPEVAPAGLSR